MEDSLEKKKAMVKAIKLSKYTKKHWTVYFKWVTFMVRKLSLNKAV